jgi:hypothetical protein
MTSRKKTEAVLESSFNQNDTWGSPRPAIQLSREVMGRIGWDPCGNPTYPLFAELTTLLPIYGGLELQVEQGVNASVVFQDSLTPEASFFWDRPDPVFINPPWSHIDPWIERLRQSETFSFVGPARVNAGWFHALRGVADHIWFPTRRFLYMGAKTQPPFHSFMAFRGCDPDALMRAIPKHFPKEPKAPFLVGLR